MGNDKNIGTDDPNPQQGHHCLKCGTHFGGDIFMKFIVHASVTDIQCPTCRTAHELDDGKSKLMATLIFFIVFFIFVAIAGVLFVLEGRANGGLLTAIFVIPIIVGFIAGGAASKTYKWNTSKLVLFGH